MAIVKIGQWRPDATGINAPITVNIENARPAPNGFAPVGGVNSASAPLPAACQGAGSALNATGTGVTTAGTSTKLYRLQVDQSWLDVSRLAGGDYATGPDSRWRFAQFQNVDTVGDLLISSNDNDVLQKLDLTSGANFEALGGTPPIGRFLATGFNGFLMVANLRATGQANRVQWCDNQNAEIWVGGEAGFQDITPGGPITQITSGQVVYIFQRDRITRMIYIGGATIMQFDDLEDGRGLVASNGLIEVGDIAYYAGVDGFYALSKSSGRSAPIGTNKINDFFETDRRSGTDLQVYAGADPLQTVVFWSYISASNSGAVPDKALIYDWSLGEWGKATVSITAYLTFPTLATVLDDIVPPTYEVLDLLPFSLDSPFWAGGKTILGVFSDDNRLSSLTGQPLALTIDTREIVSNEALRRLYIDRVMPIIDTNAATVAVGVQERQGDPRTFTEPASQEFDGYCPIHKEGRFFRGRVQVPAGETWSLMQGFDPVVSEAGEI